MILRPQLTSLALFVTAVAAPGLVAQADQIEIHQSLTDWTHAQGAPFWADDLVERAAEFGRVDHLNYGFTIDYSAPTRSLQPGTYVASARLRKALSAVDAGDLTLSVTFASNGRHFEVVLPTARQTIDRFVRTPNLSFTIFEATDVQFRLQNLDASTIKGNYDFDAFLLGKVDLGPVVDYQSLTDWGHTHGSPYWTDNVMTTQSAFRRVDRLENLWWLHYTGSVLLQPGTYTANFRLMKTSSTRGRVELRTAVSVDGASIAEFLPAAEQPIDTWVHTPDLTFTVTQPDTLARFTLNSYAGYKENYLFDAIALRRTPQFETFGTACGGASGTPSLSAQELPRQGETLQVTASGARPFSRGVMLYGNSSLDLDLSVIGMHGCRLYTQPVVNFPIASDNLGNASFQIGIGTSPALLGRAITLQAMFFDASANALGLSTTQGGRALIGN